jgi:hypothetical protein
VAALTLALGIGASSAIFGLVDAVLLRTLPVGRPEELVLIEQAMARGGTQNISRPSRSTRWCRSAPCIPSGDAGRFEHC